MNSKMLLEQYKQGERNFQNTDLKFQSFEGEDLSEVDFSYADLRGVNFVNTTLRGAKFLHAKAGLTRRSMLFLIIISLLLAGFSGYAAGINSVIAIDELFKSGIDATMVSIALIALFTAFIRGGFIEALIAIVSAIAGTAIILGIIFGFQAGQDGMNAVRDAALWTAGVGAWSLAGIWGTTVVFVLMNFIPKHEILFVLKYIFFGFGAYLSFIIWSGAHKESSFAFFLTIILTIAIIWLGNNTGYRTIKEHPKLSDLKQNISGVVSKFGTRFTNADLTNAFFNEAEIRGVDFKKAILIRTDFLKVNGLDLARISGTILLNSSVRNLLTAHIVSSHNNFARCNLQGAKLAGANLQYANFEKADLSESDLRNTDLREANLIEANLSSSHLQGANLQGANLTRLQAVGTNFYRAKMTGVCLEAWNVDRTTRLGGVICDYIYLSNGNNEKRPSSGKFDEGDFTKLFENVSNTVDLIFKDGLDWTALLDSIKKIQHDYEDIFFGIQSIENRGDGVIVVRLEVPQNANKEEIHRKIKKNYKRKLKKAKRRHREELQIKDNNYQLVFKEYMNLSKITAKIAENQEQSFINISMDSNSFQREDHSQNVNIGKDLNLTNSTFNLGEISGIANNLVNQLPNLSEQDQPSLKELLLQLKSAIMVDNSLQDEDQAEALKQVIALAEAGQNPTDGATQKLARRATTMLKGIASGLPDAASLAESLSKLLPLISSIFDL